MRQSINSGKAKNVGGKTESLYTVGSTLNNIHKVHDNKQCKNSDYDHVMEIHRIGVKDSVRKLNLHLHKQGLTNE